ncbi:retention module-containing protein, partial [Campylobacter sp. faydin G-140]|uniref:retention module-containing protein n=1 Tax=Campylobacter anatolicus TaxID=2829105 RepID=UPI001BA2DD37
MATQIGTLKQTSGIVTAVDANGNERILSAGDEIFLGDIIKTQGSNSSAVVSMNNGKDITIFANDTLSIDQSVAIDRNFEDNTIADATSLQQAILQGTDLTQLEETAAGAGGAPGGNGGTAQLNESYFIEGGHYSNVNATTSEIYDLAGLGTSAGFSGVSGASGVVADEIISDTKLPDVKITEVTPIDTDSKADDKAEKVNVKGETDQPNTKVIVKDGDGNVIGEGTTDSDGNFDITIDTGKVQPGDKVTVEVTDENGNTNSADKNAGNIKHTGDNTAPDVTVEEVTPIDSGNPADGKADQVKVAGNSDEPNAPFIVKDKDGNELGRGTTDSDGNFDITIDTGKVKPGDKVTVEVTDKAGNTGEGEKIAGDLDYPNDNEAPDAPTITFTEDADNNGVLNKAENGDSTGTTTVKVTVPDNAVVGDKIVISYTDAEGNDQKTEITIDGNVKANGTEIEIPVKDGKTSVTATVVDMAGNESESATGSIEVDTKLPDVKITEVTPIDTDSKADDKAEKVNVKGETDQPNTKVIVKDGDGNV